MDLFAYDDPEEAWGSNAGKCGNGKRRRTTAELFAEVEGEILATGVEMKRRRVVLLEKIECLKKVK